MYKKKIKIFGLRYILDTQGKNMLFSSFNTWTRSVFIIYFPYYQKAKQLG